MTTIAYRDGVLAADSRAADQTVKSYGIQKLYRLKKKGAIIGTAGSIVKCQAFVKWYANKRHRAPKLEDDDLSAIVLHRDGRVELFEDSVESIEWNPAEPLAVGTGAPAALAAMACGKTAAEAVEIACRIDPDSEGPVVSESWR